MSDNQTNNRSRSISCRKVFIERAARDVAEMFFGRHAQKDEQRLSQRTAHRSPYWEDFENTARLMAELEPLSSDADILAVAGKYNQASTIIAGRSGKRALVWMLATAASLVFALAVFYLQPSDTTAPDGTSLRYVTRIGEQKNVTLEDGSVITLNTGTEIRVRLADERREVILRRGEAYFSVAPNPVAPFTVNLGSRSVTVLGTEFNIFKSPEKFTLSVLEGAVAIHDREDEVLSEAPKLQVPSGEKRHIFEPGQFRVEAGMVAELDEHKRELVAYMPEQINDKQSWRKGIVRFYEAPLSEVIQELNRYSAKKIVIQDASIMNLKVFASIRVNEPGLSLLTLDKLLPIRVVKYFDQIVLVAEDMAPDFPGNKDEN